LALYSTGVPGFQAPKRSSPNFHRGFHHGPSSASAAARPRLLRTGYGIPAFNVNIWTGAVDHWRRPYETDSPSSWQGSAAPVVRRRELSSPPEFLAAVGNLSESRWVMHQATATARHHASVLPPTASPRDDGRLAGSRTPKLPPATGLQRGRHQGSGGCGHAIGVSFWRRTGLPWLS